MLKTCFNPLKSGHSFQIVINYLKIAAVIIGFNPLKSGHSFQIYGWLYNRSPTSKICFNPLKSGHSFQILVEKDMDMGTSSFQSP